MHAPRLDSPLAAQKRKLAAKPSKLSPWSTIYRTRWREEAAKKKRESSPPLTYYTASRNLRESEVRGRENGKLVSAAQVTWREGGR